MPMYDDDEAITRAFDTIDAVIPTPKNTGTQLGAKYDQGKLIFGAFTQGLAPVIKGVVAVLTYGSQKYSRDSWQYVLNGKQRYYDAFERHMNDYNMGILYDEESGLPVLFHAICDLMFVCWFELQEKMAYNKFTFNKPPEKK